MFKTVEYSGLLISPYPFLDLPYALPVHPEYVAPIAAAAQPPQVPLGPVPAPQIRVTAPATNPIVIPARSSRQLPLTPALVDPGRHLEEYAASYSRNVQCHCVADMIPTVSASQSHEAPADRVHSPSRAHSTAAAHSCIPAQSSVPVSYTLVPSSQC